MKARGCLVWILRIVGAIVLLLVLIGVAGFFWQGQAEAQDLIDFPPQGDLLTVDGRTMHLYCQGEGSPTVILDAGLGGWSVDFEDMQAELAQTTRACSYDRAGFGWSDPAEGERDAQAMSDDLLALMDAADMTDPVILVGFSYSGLSTRLLTIQNPDRVAGLILLDPAHEDDPSLFPEEVQQQQEALAGAYGFFGNLARVGFVRFVEPEEMAPYAPFIPLGKSDRYYAEVSTPQWWFSSQQEFLMLYSGISGDIVREAGSLPDVPVVVIGATVEPEIMTDETIAERRASLESLAAQSAQGEFVLAEGSDHDDMVNRTDLVLAAIQSMIGEDT